MNTRPIILLILWIAGTLLPLTADEYSIEVVDTVYQRISDDFYGIQYHAYTYSDSSATRKLERLNLKWIRIWADISEFHPQPEQWDWSDLDNKIAEIRQLDYQPIVCLYQSEKWFIGTADNPWWNHAEGLTEWEIAADSLARRYRDDIEMFIIFDEINVMHADRDYYITFQDAARFYLRAARKIKVAHPACLCGGPSGFGGWENGHWGNYVLAEPNSKYFLDFISCNLFISWDAEDSDDLIMNRTIWYEEAPLKIRTMMGNGCPGMLVLDAYNASALWELDGELWTDPRNTDYFGAIYHVAALLHSARGGYDLTLHWETIGGFGILSWYPRFEELPPYHAWRFLIGAIGFTDSAEVLGCRTSESPRTDAVHHGGMTVPLYNLQPFTIRRADGSISLVLINKYNIGDLTASISLPEGMTHYDIYRFEEDRMTDSLTPLAEGETNPDIRVACPPYSITVVRFHADDSSTSITPSHLSASEYNLHPNYPNPFNAATSIRYTITKPCQVKLQVFDLAGNAIANLENEYRKPGTYRIHWNATDTAGQSLPSGIYLYRLTLDTTVHTRKMILLK